MPLINQTYKQAADFGLFLILIYLVKRNLIMKLNLKFFIVLCFGAVLIYTGCKKLSDPSLSDPVLTPQVVAGQIAANLSGSLFGGLGAFDVSGGLSAPSTVALNANGRTLTRDRLQ